MTVEEIKEILKKTKSDWKGDNAFQGLEILKKYAKGDVICAAEHDIIYSIDVQIAITQGITKENCIALGKLNWMVSDFDCFACFV